MPACSSAQSWTTPEQALRLMYSVLHMAVQDNVFVRVVASVMYQVLSPFNSVCLCVL